MDPHILIACTGALINMALSVTIPCVLKESKQPFMQDIKLVFKTNRQVIITSSMIVALTIYLALKLTPEVSSTLHELTGLDLDTPIVSDFNSTPIIRQQYPKGLSNEMPPQLLNLIKLMQSK